MAEQSAREAILNKTLYVLVRQLGLTPAEVVQLRLPHLHLAGKNPNIMFIPADSEGDSKTVELDLETHRALVGWLVARPDSTTDFLFPGSHGDPMPPEVVQQAVEEMDISRKTPESSPESTPVAPEPAESETEFNRPSPGEETVVSRSRPVPPPSRPEMGVPPPSRPEMGAPPPGLNSTVVSSLKPSPVPPTAPEMDEPVNIPLPTSAPKPPPAPESAFEPPKPPESGEEPGQEEIPAANFTGTAGETQKTESDTGPEPAEPQKTEEKEKVDTPASPPPGEEKRVARPVPKKKAKPTAAQAAGQTGPGKRQPVNLSRLIIPVVAVVVILACVMCAGSGWFVWQSDLGRSFVAGLGGATAETEATEPGEETPDVAVFESPLESPVPTATLPPTPTPTALPATDTPAPTETATPIPPDTPSAEATDTPVPTDTPAPTDTPVPAEPTETATPADTPTPAMKYEAPVLVEPEDEYSFIQGNTIVLRWQPVGELAPDEQYAVRLVYRFQNEVVYQGAQVKEPQWTVPLSLFGQVDGPDYVYEWFVVVERLNDDGSGTAISPESEKRRFYWR